jgi:hypothetical protein
VPQRCGQKATFGRTLWTCTYFRPAIDSNAHGPVKKIIAALFVQSLVKRYIDKYNNHAI